MARADLSDLAAFACIAKHRNFRRAAEELGVSTSALSHALRGLEARLGLRLLNRTSRSMAPTEAGTALLARLDPALAEIAAAVDEATALRDGPPLGTLRINAPRSACRLVLLPLVTQFLAAYPRVRIEIIADDALSDVVVGGFDAGVRFGERLARDMIASRSARRNASRSSARRPISRPAASRKRPGISPPTPASVSASRAADCSSGSSQRTARSWKSPSRDRLPSVTRN